MTQFPKLEDIGGREQYVTDAFSRLIDVKYPESPIEQILSSSTAHLYADSMTKARNSYNADEFDVPKALYPFIYRDIDFRSIDGFHNKRVDYIEAAVNHLDREPFRLVDYERYLFDFYIKHIQSAHDKSNATRSNAWLQFRLLETNIADIYAWFSIKKFGSKRYLSGISKKLHSKRMPSVDLLEYYNDLHPHAIVFLSHAPGPFQQLIPDNAVWAKEFDRTKPYSDPSNGLLGHKMLEAGQENRHYLNTMPHEIHLDDGIVKHITIVDRPPKEIYFKVTYDNGSISLGAMSSLYENNIVIASLSDLISDLILNNHIDTYSHHKIYDLAGCMARDMFVCEERERYYTISQVKKKKNAKKANLHERFIWLPRFKYDITQSHAEDDLMTRVIQLSPAHVSGHKRKCVNPSEKQIELAEEVGYPLPPGFTFVGEYDRSGSSEFRRKYKSKSAMQLIFGRA